MKCPTCKTEQADTSKFCSECGQQLQRSTEPTSPSDKGARKHTSILFSDLSGYTSMSEKLDPEEVKEIMNIIFEESSQIIAGYGGIVEKFIGDAIMAIFGVPIAHEDDPVRAIKAAEDIHNLVEMTSKGVKDRIGRDLLMHSGINTGLAVTGGEKNITKGMEIVTGDTINLASRLSDLASPGEILVGENTYKHAQDYFVFEQREPTSVKGKKDPIRSFKVLHRKKRASTIHRLSGMRSQLIGREAEMASLNKSLEHLGKEKGSIISVIGEAGTGKSRLVAEFRDSLDKKDTQWIEGRCHAYAQNIPYYLFVDLIRRTWHIEEKDSPEEAQEKLETNIKRLRGMKEEVIPYIGSLLGLRYKETETADPQYWKNSLSKSVKTLFSSLTKKDRTIICLEDLHWADASSVELLQFILKEADYPSIFLCVYRPVFTQLSSKGPDISKISYQEIYLKDLSQNQTQDMLKSLLKADTIPEDLSNFVKDKVEGNPFYLEEVINSLIEMDTLVRDNGDWRLTSQLTESIIPPTLTEVITARIDRLESEMKRVLQEASVVGRVFLLKILKQITEIKDHVERYLEDLEITDLIRKISTEPELEYIFKHALTQDVVYNGLLKKERKEIHERIGQVIEVLFQDRLPEFYETLAFHFKQGQSVLKAIDYLMKSGRKSLHMYAVEESQQYYQEAFDLFANKTNMTKEETSLFVNLIIDWALVYYYRGDFKGSSNLLETYEDIVKSFGDKSKLGMFYTWRGHTLFIRENIKDAHHYLEKALKIGEEIGDQKIIGYACTWLAWNCAELGMFEQGISYGERAFNISQNLKSDYLLFQESLNGLAQNYWYIGRSKINSEIGKKLIDYGSAYSNVRCLLGGHISVGMDYLTIGDILSAITEFKKAIEVSVDPLYTEWPKFMLGMCYIQTNQIEEAEEILRNNISFSERYGYEYVGTAAKFFMGVVLVAMGQMAKGIKMMEDACQYYQENAKKSSLVIAEYVTGKVFYEIAAGAGPITFSTITKNIGFLIKNIPFASKKAETHLNKAIEVAQEIGANGLLAQAYLDLGLLYKKRKRKEVANNFISKSIQIFEEAEAEIFLKHAKEALASL